MRQGREEKWFFLKKKLHGLIILVDRYLSHYFQPILIIFSSFIFGMYVLMRVWSCIVVSITSSEASQRDAVYFGYLTRIQINFCSGHDMKGVVRIIGWYSLYHGYPPQVRMDFSSIHDVKAPRGEWQARRGIWFLVLFSRCLVVILPCICKYKLPFFSFPSFPCHYFRDQSLSYPYSSFSSSCSCSRSCSHSSSSFILVRISVHVPPIPIFFLSFFLT